MRKYITTLMMLLLGGTGVAHAQCVTYSLGYAVYSTYSLDNAQGGSAGVVPGSGSVTISGFEQSTQTCRRWLAGGDCQQWITSYDSGMVSITVNGFTVSTSYGSTSTASSIATALAAALNGTTGSPVTASASGGVVSLTANETGVGTVGTNYTLSATSSTHYLSTYGAPSFSAAYSGITLVGTAATNVGGGIFTSVLVDGSASMTVTQSSTCPYPEYMNTLNELPNATHTPLIESSINGSGGWTTGSPVCVTCYLSEQQDTDSGPITVGTQYPVTYGAEVNCSVGGLIFSWFPSTVYLEKAYTQDLFTGVKDNYSARNRAGSIRLLTNALTCQAGEPQHDYCALSHR